MPFPILNGAVVAAGLLGGVESPRPKLPRLDHLPKPGQLEAPIIQGLRELRDKAREVRKDFEKRTDGDYSEFIAALKEQERLFEQEIVKFGGTVEVEKEEGEKKK
jgi:hypothetical protein